MGVWREYTKRDGEMISLETTGSAVEIRTRFQKLDIHDTVAYGRALFLDDKIQSSESDEFVYHEALVHPAMVCNPAPRRVLIAGGGEGATLREILKHNTVAEAIMVDLDEDVVAIAREHLPSWSNGAFDDPRTVLVHADARAYLEDSDLAFDVVVVDVTDPLAGGPSYRLFTREFYQLVLDRLTPGGTIAVQAESADLGVMGGFVSIVRTLASVFPVARGYHTHVPSFGESWGFAVACKPGRGGESLDPSTVSADSVDRMLRARGLSDSRFYDGVTHRRLFSPPIYERAMMAESGPIITDDEPLTVA